MRRIILIYAVAAAFLCIGCTADRVSEREVQRYTDFLYANMPSADKAVHDRSWWEASVRKTLEVRRSMDWDIPEREFLHFVLPLRVNNEDLDDFRMDYADTLCSRVRGMSLHDAALEINHWCHEMATYRPSDARTSSPEATIRSGLGRCGEESVLGVSAFRAAGIPARQVYTPRWAHTDDNHAWVEVWVDGKWHFLGACEPEPELDMAWFNAPVSRAMLLHTKAFGDYHGDEDVISRTAAYTEINVTRSYVPVRRSEVTVRDSEGAAVPGARVLFMIYNYAEFYTVADYISDASGKVALDTGLGDAVIFATMGNRFGIAKASSESSEVVLDHALGERFCLDMDIVPPAENPIPVNVTDAQVAANQERFERENELREARPKGNASVTDGFLAAHAGDGRAAAILSSLSSKDMNDVSADVLEDALSHCGAEFDRFRDCPRVENEFLSPYFAEIGKGLDFGSAAAVEAWVADKIAVDDAANPQHLRIPPVNVWRERCADTRSRNIFFVALCRAAGFRARIDDVTGKTQYADGDAWVDARFGEAPAAEAPKGMLRATFTPASRLRDPLYYRHFSLSHIYDGTPHLLSFDESEDQPYSRLFKEARAVDAGYYMMVSGTRMADGGVLAHVEFFDVPEARETVVPLVVRTSDTRISVIGSMDAEALYMPDGSDTPASILSTTGRGYFIVAVVGDKDEPTTHAVRQLSAAASELNAWGRKVVVLGKARPEGLDHMAGGSDIDRGIFNMLAAGTDSESKILPIVSICDSFGRIVYYSQGYNTSLAEELKNVISQL